MEIHSSKKSVLTLVEERPSFTDLFRDGPNGKPYVLFCTISPNPQTKVDTMRNGKTTKIPFGILPQIIQYRYCLKILRESYLEFCADPIVIGTPELNDSGNCHLHFLLYDKNISNDVLLKVFRRDVMLTPLSIANMHKKSKIDYMNNIVKLTKSVGEIIIYMDKDHTKETREYFNNFYREASKDKKTCASQIDCSASTEKGAEC